MKNMGRRLGVIVHDLLMVVLAWVLAYLVRFNFSFEQIAWSALYATLPWILAGQGAVLAGFRLYRGVWRFASIPDLWNLMRAVAVGTLLIGLMLFMFNRLVGMPRSILVLYPVFLLMLLGGPRLIYRVWKDRYVYAAKLGDCKRVLIVGAGRAAEMLARDMRRGNEYLPVGFIDDNPRWQGARIQGIPVAGTTQQLPKVVNDLGVDIIMIAIPSATNAQMRRLVGLCEQTGIPIRTLPRIDDLVSGGVTINALREVAIEDLLGRDPVSLDWKGITAGLAGNTVLVTGGGGSIGSEFCRQIARLGPKALVVFERCEFNLYSIELELRQKFPNLVLHPCLGDTCDAVAVEQVFNQYRPEVVFHAAAYKHVPLLQDQARQAVRNNVFGTKVVAEAADNYGCETFVLISTDKAVNPTNVMGTTKRVAELYCQALDRHSNTQFITVRFGNVLGSAGSVVPLFRKQIESGGPVTVTHPDITRFFMTIPEACQLIMQAAVMGQGGEIFVLNMGEPVKIGYLAEQMIRLSGKTPGTDIEIVYVGLRPGEKLYEELFYAQEELAKTSHVKIMRAQSSVMDREVLFRTFEEMEQACDACDEEQINSLLKKLVPQMDTPSPLPDNVISFDRAQGA